MFRRALISLIQLYRRYLSPLKRHTTCKYLPTCSQYGIEAIRNRGALEGLLWTLWRVLRCNPFSKGGYDPAPQPRERSGNGVMKRSLFSLFAVAALLSLSLYAAAEQKRAPKGQAKSATVQPKDSNKGAPKGTTPGKGATTPTPKVAPAKGGPVKDAAGGKGAPQKGSTAVPAAPAKDATAVPAAPMKDATAVRAAPVGKTTPAAPLPAAPQVKTGVPPKKTSPHAQPFSKYQSVRRALLSPTASKDRRLTFENDLIKVQFTLSGAVPLSFVLKKKQYRERVVPKSQLKLRKGTKVEQQMDLIKTWSPWALPFQLSMTVEKTAESLRKHTLWYLDYATHQQEYKLVAHKETKAFTEWTFALLVDTPCTPAANAKGELCYPFALKKIYRAYPDRYDLDLELRITNTSTHNIKIKGLEFQVTSLHEGESARSFFQPVSLQKEAICYADGDVHVQSYSVIKDGQKSSGCMGGCGGGGCGGGCSSCSCQRQASKSSTFSHGSRWAGIDARYFLLVLIKNYTADDGGCRFSAQSINESSDYGVIHSFLNVGESAEFKPGTTVPLYFKIYGGPKDMNYLEKVRIFEAPPKLGQRATPSASPELEESIDFGLLGIIGRLMIALLKVVYQFVGNWGLAIIFLTMLIKLATLYFTTKSMRSMKRMAALKPEMDDLQRRYGSNREKLNQEMMALYKKHDVKPLSGCLPMFLQMPIYIAWYQGLMASVELYRAPLFGWISDLTARDPYYILPLLMGATMFLQQKMSPTTSDNSQAKMMMYMMPIMFTGIMLFLPSGLTLYILTNTVLSLTHQWYLNHTDA